jgi:hypothetical protein
MNTNTDSSTMSQPRGSPPNATTCVTVRVLLNGSSE